MRASTVILAELNDLILLVFTRGGWQAFAAGVRRGEFDKR
jgi:hypothetical protein